MRREVDQQYTSPSDGETLGTSEQQRADAGVVEVDMALWPHMASEACLVGLACGSAAMMRSR